MLAHVICARSRSDSPTDQGVAQLAASAILTDLREPRSIPRSEGIAAYLHAHDFEPTIEALPVPRLAPHNHLSSR